MTKNSTIVNDIEDKFIKLFVEDTQAEILDDPIDPQTNVGLP
jgi:hypothetical protein